ncbi:peptidyl-tRNA hydrolase, PTH2 family [Nematocida parisii]|uniref:peptidyl-tRNA hydrolase n=1 Tax=Nematocida parisii (strain ERTm3) TaxID=935791 RepID=I3EGP2_NEMP3|nr:hypothetical protein NEQG_01079 [Nematocida parisii ERTm3]KAI5145976.1 peptidyl-tRNA hydrolase, PTH2 family [Nematocida parisii]KAI5153011.1 peptidyl-tRNA hydrolase, PTH2 family [Nematocida parisii]KAI5157921.1 peptidyl-tRNA hydrolase, PTH2 family [Nematocida parisii]
MTVQIILTVLLSQIPFIVYLIYRRNILVHCSNGKRQRKSTNVTIDRNRPVKGVLVVRNDLKMGKGKIVSQAMHAAYQAATQDNPLNSVWKYNGFKKTSLKANTKEELDAIVEQVEAQHIPYTSIVDAGRTQVEPNTHTVTFIGPWYEDEIDLITGNLKLL